MSGGALTNLATSPSITIYAADGAGTLTTTTAGVVNGSTGNTITFTYTAATGGMSNGAVTLAVPSGWTAPVTTNAIGCTTTSTGSVSASGQTITVSGVTLTSGGTFTITYGAISGGSCSAGDGATAPTTPGAQTWQAQEKSTPGGTLANLGSSPSINVYAANGTGIADDPNDQRVSELYRQHNHLYLHCRDGGYGERLSHSGVALRLERSVYHRLRRRLHHIIDRHRQYCGPDDHGVGRHPE